MLAIFPKDCGPKGELFNYSLTVLTFTKNRNCPKKMLRKFGAAMTEGGIIGLDDNFSTTIRITKNIPEMANRSGLLSSKAGFPSVVPRTNEVAEMVNAPSPQ